MGTSISQQHRYVEYEGFDHLYVQNKNTIKFKSKKAIIDYKYLASSGMVNSRNDLYFLTAFFFKAKYENIEFGLSNSVLSGASSDIDWSRNKAHMYYLIEKI